MTRRANQIERARAPWRRARSIFRWGFGVVHALLGLRGRTRFRCAAAARGRALHAGEDGLARKRTTLRRRFRGSRTLVDRVPLRAARPAHRRGDQAQSNAASRRSRDPSRRLQHGCGDRRLLPPGRFGLELKLQLPFGRLDDQHRHANCLFLLFQIRSSQLHARRLGRQLAQGRGPRGPAPGPDLSEAGRL